MSEQQEHGFIPLEYPRLSPATTEEEKQRNWRTMAEYVDRIGDRLGMKVDTGIKDTVVVLNVFGTRTSQSCEGHIERGIAAPWVDFAPVETEETKALQLKADESLALAEEREQAGADEEELSSLYREHHKLAAEARRVGLEEVRKVMGLLSDFYKERQVPYNQQLTIQPRWRGGRLESNGSAIQEILPQEEREMNLNAYREEMKAFTDFLKDKYSR